MANLTALHGVRPFLSAYTQVNTRARQIVSKVAIRLSITAMIGLTTSIGAAQTVENKGTSEVIPAPPSEADILGAPITSLTADIRVKENPNLKNDMPPSAVPANFNRRGEMSYVMHRPGAEGICYMWDSPATCNNPLYFEDVNLERHGYSLKYLRAFQPVVSGAEFFATVPTLPYQLTAMPPCECVYTLGEYLPGDCVPYQFNWPPWSTVGGVVEAGTAVGLAILIP